MKKIMSQEEAWDLADTMRNSLKIQNEIGFGDMPFKAPGIDFYQDDQEFYDPAQNEIHLGVYGIVSLFGVEPGDEEDFINAVNYVRGHEEQHRRSTASVPYAWGINRGTQVIIEYIANEVEKSRRRFRNDREYAEYANTVLPSRNIYINFQMVQRIVQGIANSIEDGRIERIRAVRFPGFERLRMVYRGRFWCSDSDLHPWDEIKNNTTEKLRVIANQILSLATCQLYEKGFTGMYAGTPMASEVKKLMPYIARGVMAGRTRDMAMEVVEICKAIAPYIYETCKMSETDIQARKVLEEILASMISAMVDQMPTGNGLSEKDEDTDEGSADTAFPHSDLIVTLPDDVYDKLVKNSKPKTTPDGGGLMVRREHPKEEKKGDESKNASGSSASQAKDGNKPDGTEMKDGGGSGSRDEKKEKSSANSERSGGQPDGSFGESQDTGSGFGNPARQDAKTDGKAGDAGESDASGEKTSETESSPDLKTRRESRKENKEDPSEPFDMDLPGQPSGGLEKTGGEPKDKTEASPITGKNHEPEKTNADAEKAIEAAMKKAAESAREAAKLELDNVYVNAAHSRSTTEKTVDDTSSPIKAEDVKDICSDFKEYKRKYSLTEKLPPVLKARGKTLLRKNQRYFKSLSTPNVSYLDSGSVDPSRIYGLSFGDTDIFRKKGIDKKFDGCAYILMDNSGSMAGDKRVEACKSAAIIEESFRGLIPIKITAFDYQYGVIHEVIKGWDEQQKNNCCWNFCLHGRQGYGNADAYDIQIATRELLSRPERKKLLLVLSDGEPAEATQGATKGAIEAARKKGIQVTGIYFEEGDTVQYSKPFFGMYGTKDGIACPLKDLDANIERVMKRFSRS